MTIWAWPPPIPSPPWKPERGRSSAPSTASGSGNVVQGPPGSAALRYRYPHRASIFGQPTAEFDDQFRPATEQSYRWAERFRARGGYSSGWLPEGEEHLRDHGSALGGRAGK